MRLRRGTTIHHAAHHTTCTRAVRIQPRLSEDAVRPIHVHRDECTRQGDGVAPCAQLDAHPDLYMHVEGMEVQTIPECAAAGRKRLTQIGHIRGCTLVISNPVTWLRRGNTLITQHSTRNVLCGSHPVSAWSGPSGCTVVMAHAMAGLHGEHACMCRIGISWADPDRPGFRRRRPVGFAVCTLPACSDLKRFALAGN